MLIPFSAERYLDSFELPDHPNVFVLGSFARHVTIYSQQVRALNLIHSLVNTRRLRAGCSILVVGGGAAGITAAASVLLSVAGTKVTLLEKLEDVMPLQRGSAKRFVHPHIYDWPEEGSTDEDAKLPIFDWRAGEARIVAEKLIDEWGSLRASYKNRLAFKSSARLTSIHSMGDAYEVTWKDQDGSHRKRADLIILAMGFGRDTDPLLGEDYWQDNWIDQARGTSSHWLVSGTGDGGLTDLMRLKVRGFQHHLIIGAFSEGRNHPLEEIQKVLERTKPENELEALSNEFGASLQQALDAQGIRQDTEVVLNDEKELTRARASLLNRIITHELQQAGAFTFYRGRLGTPIEEGKKYRAPEISGRIFDRVLIRRGPSTDVPIHQIEQIEVDDAFKDAYKRLHDRWRDWTDTHNPREDVTRIPCWTALELNAERGFKLRSTSVEKRREAGACLTIVGDKTPWNPAHESEFERTIRQAVADTGGSITFSGIELSGKPHLIKASEAFSTPLNHSTVVGLLCEAPVAIFDVTDLEPAVMILLGVRAAVRRGVTITVSRTAAAPDFWAMLPFNLREVNPISMVHPPGSRSTDRQSPISLLSHALKNAATELQREQHYSDLPGYFELRMPSSQGLVDEDSVLLLCPFSPDYLRTSYQGFLGPDLQGIFKAKEVHLMSDLTSPKLLAMRLYDAIRRTFFCLVDWTSWRPNVMFELGVRIAASDQITVSLIDRTAAVPESVANLNEQLLQLKQFFSPVEYDPVGGPGQFEAVRNLLEVYEGRAITDIPKLFEIGNEHRTFSKASEAVRTEIDPGLQPVEDLLSAAARALARHADQQPEVLFGSDPRIGQLAQQAAIERLLASWYFVKYRRLALDPADKKCRELLDDLGNDLLARLPGEDPVRADIERELTLLNGGGL